MVSMHGAGLYNDRYGSYRLAEAGPTNYTEHEQVVVAEVLADLADLQMRLAGITLGHPTAATATRRTSCRHWPRLRRPTWSAGRAG